MPRGTRVLTVALLLWLLPVAHLSAQCPVGGIALAIASKDTAAMLSVAKALEACPAQRDSLGLIHHQLGVRHYVNGHIGPAIQHTLRAKAIREALSEGRPLPDLGQTCYNLGAFYQEAAEYRHARDALIRALQVYQSVGERPRQYDVQLLLGSVYVQLGDYAKARNALEYVLEGTDDTYQRAEACLNLSHLHLGQRRPEEAVRWAECAIEVFAPLGEQDNLARAFHNLAMGRDGMGHYAEAIGHAQKAQALYQSIGDHRHEASLGHVLGLACLHAGHLEEAGQHFHSAMQLAREHGYLDILANGHDNLGELALRRKDYPAAMKAFEQAAQTSLPELARQRQLTPALKPALDQVAHKAHLVVVAHDYARAALAHHAATGDATPLHQALQYLLMGDYLVDGMRYTHSSQATKLVWREKVVPFYEQAVAVCHALQDVERAFFFFEKGKSILLIEALLANQAETRLPDELRGRMETLNQKLLRARQHLAGLDAKTKAKALEGLFALEREQEALWREVDAVEPAYRAALRAEPVAYRAFQSAFIDGQGMAMVHYFWGKAHVYALALWPGGGRLVRLAPTDSLSKQVEVFLGYFDGPEKIANAPALFLAQAEALHTQLVAPLGLPKGLADIALVPDGPLAYLPFDALVQGRGGSLATASYLVRDFNLLYAYSASFLVQVSEGKAQRRPRAMAMAPFAGQGSAGYTPLPYSGGELTAIGGAFAFDAYRNDAARLATFREVQHHYGLLHLATHAFASLHDGGTQPHIAFADTALYLHDLYQMRIPAQLVVLSACQSHTGHWAEGEGVLGLGRGFFHAGVKGVVASLWNLNDQSTGALVASFYKKLKDTHLPAAALRHAKLAYLQDDTVPIFRKSPYHWASLTYYGGMAPILSPPRYKGALWWGLGGMVLLFLGRRHLSRRQAGA